MRLTLMALLMLAAGCADRLVCKDTPAGALIYVRSGGGRTARHHAAVVPGAACASVVLLTTEDAP